MAQQQAQLTIQEGTDRGGLVVTARYEGPEEAVAAAVDAFLAEFAQEPFGGWVDFREPGYASVRRLA